MLETGDVLQRDLAEIDHVRGLDQRLRRRRHQDLAAMTSSHESGRAVHRRPEVVTIAFLCRPAVHPHPDPQRRRVAA